MPLNRAYIGRSWDAPIVYEVSAEKVRDYALAIGAPDPDDIVRRWFDPATESPTVPPTFPTTLWFRMGLWPLPEPDLGKSPDPWFVLGEHDVTHHRPMRVGDRLHFRSVVRDIRDLGPHELMEIEHTLTDGVGDLVCTVLDRMISRGTASVRSAA